MYAAKCLLRGRLAERDVRFIQLYHRGWDQHNDLPRDLALQCRGTDQPTAALITDLPAARSARRDARCPHLLLPAVGTEPRGRGIVARSERLQRRAS